MAHRVSSQAATDLDDIWYHVAKESGVGGSTPSLATTF
jgi:hypothetical protein